MASPAQPRLSHDFFELYKSYKRKTKIAISWLAETCNLQDTSLPAVVAAAKLVPKQNIQVPPELYFVFKDALKLRIDVAQQYKNVRSQGMDDGKTEAIEKHDFFISQFKLIFHTLFPYPPAKRLGKQLPSVCTLTTANATPKADNNRFTTLATAKSDVGPEESNGRSIHISEDVTVRGSASFDYINGNPGTQEEEEEMIIGDPLEGPMTFLTYANECDALLSDVKKIWERAANDECTVMYAALYTKLSIDLAIFLTVEVVEDLGLEDFQWLVDCHVDVMTYFDSLDQKAGHPPVKYPQFSREGAFTHAVMKPLDLFLEKRSEQNGQPRKVIKAKDYLPYQTTFLPKLSMPDIPLASYDRLALTEYVLARYQAADRLSDKRTDGILMLIQDMEVYRTAFMQKTTKRNIAALEWSEIGLVDLQMKPLLHGLDCFVACSGEDFTAELNIWLTFLYESYNSYLWRGSNLSTTSNTRLQLLRYLKEVGEAIKSVVEVAKLEDYFKRMDNLPLLSAELGRLAAVSRWDLYSQAPLVNGMAMLEVNYQSMYLGINLWNDDGIAGFALHAYNLVLSKHILKKPIPILEMLCDLLREAVFMNHRPTTNYRSALFRFMGGKVTDGGKARRAENIPAHRLHADANRNFFIEAPKRLPTMYADDRRIKPEELSKIYDLHHFKYALGAAMTKNKDDMFSARMMSKKQQHHGEQKCWGPGLPRDSDNDYDEEDWTTHIGRNVMRSLNHSLRAEVNKSENNAFPITRVNGFAVYLLFRDILKRIWNHCGHRMFTPAEILQFSMMSTRDSPHTAGHGGAIVGTLMDIVDGVGTSVVGPSEKKRRWIKKAIVLEPKVLMDLVSDAIMEAVGDTEAVEEYMWKSL